MSGLTFWQGNKKGKTFQFQDKISEEFMRRFGAPLNLYAYIGPKKLDPNDPDNLQPANSKYIEELTIQDIVLGENRDRKYSDEVYDIRGVLTLSDADYNLSQFGLTFDDSLIIEIHQNAIVKQIGRRIMPGDVIELPFMSDEFAIGSDNPIKKWIVISEVTRSAAGYGVTYLPHILRLKCKNLILSQEYMDIANKQDNNLDNWLNNLGPLGDGNSGNIQSTDNNSGNIQSTYERNIDITDDIIAQAKEEVLKRHFEFRHLYMKKGPIYDKSGFLRYICNNECIPNDWDGNIIESGNNFPTNVNEGTYFIRTDLQPSELYYRTKGIWVKQQQDLRELWVPMTNQLRDFLCNDDEINLGQKSDQQIQSRQALSKIAKPKTINDLIPLKDPYKKGDKI